MSLESHLVEDCLNDIAISARGLNMRFGNRVILDDVDIDLYSGQVTTLLGLMERGKVPCLNFSVVKHLQALIFGTLVSQEPMASTAAFQTSSTTAATQYFVVPISSF